MILIIQIDYIVRVPNNKHLLERKNAIGPF